MLKAKYKMRSIVLICLTMLATVILGLGSLFSMSKSTASAETTEIVFELGANGTATHKDGSTAKTTYSETEGDYTLSITDGSKMYPSSYDAKGNSCIKLGTSSVVGGFQFTVPDDVTSVVIYVAKYKTNATNIKVNNTSYALTKNSNDGAYDEITVDTSSTKTVTFTTVSGGVRAMVNTIKYVIESSDEPESSDTEEATTYTVTYYVPDGVTAPEAVEVTNGDTTALPAADDYQKYTFAGWVTKTLEGDTNTAPEFMKAGYEYTVTADVTLYALYTYTKENAEEAWNLVTDASFLAVGKEIVIVASDSDYALGADKGNNRNAATITKDGDTITINSDVQIITLEAGKVANTFAFNVGTGYLYAASSSSNNLKTKTTLDNNGSWNITIDANGVATIRAQGTYTRNWLRKNSNSALFSCYGSGQDDVSIYMKDGGAITYYTTSFVEEGGHSHSYDEGVVTDPTCTEDGYTTYTCECGDTYKDNYVDATGHNYEENITQDATCTEAGEKTFTCSGCDDTYTEILPATGHVFVDGACSTCGVEQPKKATLTFDDTSKRKELSNSQQVWAENGITVTNAKGSSTTNVADYFNPVRFYKSSTVTIEYPGMLIVEIVTASDSYATDLGKSISDTTVQVDGSTVTIIFAEAQASYTLTCSEQIRVNAITAYTTTAHIDSASLTVKEDIAANYYVELSEALAEDAVMYFTVDDNTYDVKGEEKAGRYVFSLDLPPHYMTAVIKAELKYNDLVLDTIEEYSIQQYAQNKLNAAESSAELKQLVSDMLHYGAAAQTYKNHNTENLATAGVGNLLPASTETPTEPTFTATPINNPEVTSYGAWFTGANVWFDSANKIMVSINTTENVTLTINGEAVEVTGKTIDTGDILPTEFGKEFVFVLSYDGVVMQTLTYSVNAYAYKMQNHATMGELALALYNYGLSAKAYAATL